MARISTNDRRRQIGDAALRAFSESGFRLTQVADIARIAGTAPGTLYLYATSKEALFVMAMERALGEEPLEVPTQELELMEAIRQKLARARASSILTTATESPGGPLPPVDTMLSQLWDDAVTLAPAINLIERCAQDWPALASLFYTEWRPDLLKRLTTYLARGIDEGIVRRAPDLALSARLIVETIAWFAIHRHGDVDGRFYPSDAVKRTTVDALVHAYRAQRSEEAKP